MIKHIIRIKDKWSIILFINIDYDNYQVIESTLEDIDTPEDVIEDIYNKIGYKYDCGFTYSSIDDRVSVVGINQTTSREELINTMSHEADHVQTTICKYYGIDLDSETAAYLIGYLVEVFYSVCYRCFY